MYLNDKCLLDIIVEKTIGVKRCNSILKYAFFLLLGSFIPVVVMILILFLGGKESFSCFLMMHGSMMYGSIFGGIQGFIVGWIVLKWALEGVSIPILPIIISTIGGIFGSCSCYLSLWIN